MSHDPNNTTWAKSTDGYGQRILSQQGWQPGDYLGARNADHSDHYTPANAAPIKILLRDDNLGLGAGVGKANAETFGLSLFAGVLGRLNGKSDVEVEKQQRMVKDAELRTYHANKFGPMNFVSGGLLVGDTIKPVEAANWSNVVSIATDSSTKRKKQSKKDKIQTTSEHSNSKKHKRRKPDSCLQPHVDEQEETEESQHLEAERDSADSAAKEIEQRKRKKRRREGASEDLSAESVKRVRSNSKEIKERSDTKRRRRKEEKRRSKASSQTTNNKMSPQPEERSEVATPVSAIENASSQGNRHAIRRRYIQSKRLALSDPVAMKEIWMLKAGA